MKDVPTKVTDSQWTAEEFNLGVNDELKNFILSLGIALSAGNLFQIAQSVASYASFGDFFVDSGAADAYVLSAIGLRKNPLAYTNGMRLRFFPLAPNTGASTVNAFAIGVKNIKDQTGADPAAGVIKAGIELQLTYDQANDYFVIGGLLTDGQIKSIVQPQDWKAASTAGTGAAYTITLAPIPSAITPGLTINALIHASNTTRTPTLDVNGLGAVNIVDENGLQVGIGDLPANSIMTFIYNGSNFKTKATTFQHRGVSVAFARVQGNATIDKSWNVTSAAKAGTGTYDITLTNPMADSFYDVYLVLVDNGTFDGVLQYQITSPTVFRVRIVDLANNPADKDFNFRVFGDLAT